MKISFESEDFEQLVELLIERLRGDLGEAKEPPKQRWISASESMALLRISSKTTLAKLRNEPDGIRFSQPTKKLILYDRESIEEYLEAHAKNPF